ncbi:hypothetical protein Mal4_36720 [Maioricimonas rarisocia]|uniref:Uncharacterized protein n=1 Tax=Maioricimonas rarisocia TaxID=2528026 RepID=A0A517ZA57_9PLAN|nr:hypothetical protein [Maioricimonas rarisocia]QDU39331.1 hypothetical protein Mal4_36720 [Maioricimonas rarisocia]
MSEAATEAIFRQRCPSCGRTLRTPTRLKGRRIRCPGCNARVSTSSRDSATRQSSCSEADNAGTRHDRVEQADAYWFARTNKTEKEPYLLYTFDSRQAARQALLEVPGIHIAHDSGQLICTRTLTFGFYESEDGRIEAIVAGWELTPELFETAKRAFRRHGGSPRNDGELSPAAATKGPAKPPARTSLLQKLFGGDSASPKVRRVKKFTRPNVLGMPCTYHVYCAPDARTAKEFLLKTPVSRPMFYLVVETPEGNWGRDKDGIYQE